MAISNFNPYRREHKYHAKPTEYDGLKYPSIAEAVRASQLDDLMMGNEIDWWLRQVPIRLGKDCIYRVDFLVGGLGAGPDRMFMVWAEDVKGVETAQFRKIRKLWKQYGPFALHVIKGKKTEIIWPEGGDSDA